MTSSELTRAAERLDTVGEVRYAGSLLFADDDLVLCLFEATAVAGVQQASDRAGIPWERVMRLVWLGPSDNGRSYRCGSS